MRYSQLSMMCNTHKSWVESVTRLEEVEKNIETAQRKWAKAMENAESDRVKAAGIMAPEPENIAEERKHILDYEEEKRKQKGVTLFYS